MKKPAKQARSVRARSNNGDGTPRVTTRRDRGGNTMVLATIAAAILSTLISVKLLTPLFLAASIAPFFYKEMKRRKHYEALILVIRWTLALFVTLLVIGVFAPGRLGASIPFALGASNAMGRWIFDGTGGPTPGLAYLTWGTLIFVVTTIVSGGLLGFVVASIGIGGAAYAALLLFKHGYNIIQIALVAVPIWHWSLIAACVSLTVPTASLFYQRVFPDEDLPIDHGWLKRSMFIGGGLFVFALLLRLSLAGAWQTLVSGWTIG